MSNKNNRPKGKKPAFIKTNIKIANQLSKHEYKYIICPMCQGITPEKSKCDYCGRPT